MARDIYSNVIAKADPASGVLSALAEVQITVKLAGTATLATIYKARTGATQGPTVASGALGNNPFTTSVTGSAEFWADAGAYDVEVHDTHGPPRVTDQTLAWNSIPAVAGGIPSGYLAGDGDLPYASFSPQILRQDIPIGGTIDWWRPSTSFDAGGGAGNPPLGFAICDGRSIPEADHDFGPIGSVAMPDLRNAFVLGALHTKANGTAAVANTDVPTDGPGIGGTGGAHKIILTLPAHRHGVGSLVAGANGEHNHGGQTGSMNRSNPHLHNSTYEHLIGGGPAPAVALGTTYSQVAQANITGNSDIQHEHPINGSGTHSHAMSGQVGNTAASSGDTSYNAVAQDLRPRYVGMLKIMKVTRD